MKSINNLVSRGALKAWYLLTTTSSNCHGVGHYKYLLNDIYVDTSLKPNTSSSMISDRTMIRTRIKFVFPIVSWLTARLDTTLVLYQDGAHSTYVLLGQKQNMQYN